MPNSPVPAAATGLPNVPPALAVNVSIYVDTFRPATPGKASNALDKLHPTLPLRFPLADDFTGTAGQLIALSLVAQAARRRLDAALAMRGGARG